MQQPEKSKAMRLNKFLSDAGVCSRRQADQYIEDGKVFVDGRKAVMGERVSAGQEIVCCGKPVRYGQEKKVLLAFYKPRGVVCTTSKRDENNIVDYINYKTRIYPVGRLDKDSEGLILLTNEGALSDQILRGSNAHEKEYVVTLNTEISDADLQRLREGVPILDTVTRPCRVYRKSPNIFHIILTQGLNRQIRRMCEYLGYHVVYLKRIRIMNIMLDGIEKGCYREVTGKELEDLQAMLHDKKMEKKISEQFLKRRMEKGKQGGSYGKRKTSQAKRADSSAKPGVKGVLSGNRRADG